MSLVQSQQLPAGSQGEPPGAQTQTGLVPRPAAALDAAPSAVDSPERSSGSGRFSYHGKTQWLAAWPKTPSYSEHNLKNADSSICRKSWGQSFLLTLPLSFFFLQSGEVLHLHAEKFARL